MASIALLVAKELKTLPRALGRYATGHTGESKPLEGNLAEEELRRRLQVVKRSFKEKDNWKERVCVQPLLVEQIMTIREDSQFP